MWSFAVFIFACQHLAVAQECGSKEECDALPVQDEYEDVEKVSLLQGGLRGLGSKDELHQRKAALLAELDKVEASIQKINPEDMAGIKQAAEERAEGRPPAGNGNCWFGYTQTQHEYIGQGAETAYNTPGTEGCAEKCNLRWGCTAYELGSRDSCITYTSGTEGGRPSYNAPTVCLKNPGGSGGTGGNGGYNPGNGGNGGYNPGGNGNGGSEYHPGGNGGFNPGLDTPGWSNGYGMTCSSYESNGWCSRGQISQPWTGSPSTTSCGAIQSGVNCAMVYNYPATNCVACGKRN